MNVDIKHTGRARPDGQELTALVRRRTAVLPNNPGEEFIFEAVANLAKPAQKAMTMHMRRLGFISGMTAK